MITSEYVLAAPALAVIWPCIALAMMFGCVWGLAGQRFPEGALLPIAPPISP